MSSFEVLVRTVSEVFDHPNADRLSIVRVLGYEAISAKNEDGSHRFEPGEAIVYVPEAAIVPEALLKERGFWNEDKDIGLLAGKRGDRVKAIKLRGILSQGLVWKTTPDAQFTDLDDLTTRSPLVWVQNVDQETGVLVGDDVAEFFGIIKYDPPVPAGMSGDVFGMAEFAYNFDIENIQTFPDMLVNDEVEATEKLHGTNFRISYRRGVTHEDLFAGDVAITSKGMGAKGLVFKANEKNFNGNLYVRTAMELGLIERVRELGKLHDIDLDLFGEVYGVGVQDLHYGTTKPQFRAFDVRVNGDFLDAADKAKAMEDLGVERVPILYRGPFDRAKLEEVRDGQSTLGGCIREGIVVTATGDQSSRPVDYHSIRPSLKMISPDYLVRKDATEFN